MFEEVRINHILLSFRKISKFFGADSEVFKKKQEEKK